MSRYVLLDSGPLGMVAHPDGQKNTECKAWLKSLLAAGVLVRVPEAADYETRRSMLLQQEKAKKNNQKYRGMERLETVIHITGPLPLSTTVIRFAAQMWAEARLGGKPTAGDKALDADVLICAQAKLLELDGHTVEVATVDEGDLKRLGVMAKKWTEIVPDPDRQPNLLDMLDDD